MAFTIIDYKEVRYNKQITYDIMDVEKIVPLYKRLEAELIGTFSLVFAAICQTL
jgi:hypothetical protein